MNVYPVTYTHRNGTTTTGIARGVAALFEALRHGWAASTQEGTK